MNPALAIAGIAILMGLMMFIILWFGARSRDREG